MHEISRTVTRTATMSPAETAFHWFMMLGTCFLWYPLYHARRKAIHRVRISSHYVDR